MGRRSDRPAKLLHGALNELLGIIELFEHECDIHPGLAGKNPFSGGAAYCASKAGLNAFSEALMQEVRYDDIRVSYVMPGSVATGFSGGDESRGADWKIAPDEVADVVLNLVRHSPRSLPSRVELRPSKPRK